MNNKKGVVLLQYLVYLPVMVLALFTVYTIFTTLFTANKEAQDMISFTYQTELLEGKILKSITSGEDTLTPIDGDLKNGFIINGDEYPIVDGYIDKLPVSATINGLELNVTFKYRTREVHRLYTVNYWGRTHE